MPAAICSSRVSSSRTGQASEPPGVDGCGLVAVAVGVNTPRIVET